MKLGTRLTFILILVGFLPLLLGGLFLFYFFEGHIKEITYRNLQEVREVAFLEIDSFIKNSLTDLTLLSRNAVLTGEEVSLKKVEEELQRIKEQDQLLFRDVGLLDKDGRITASTMEDFYQNEESERWIRVAKEKKEVVVSDIYKDDDLEKQMLVVLAPILNARREVVSFIIAWIEVDPLFQEIDFKIGEEGKVMLVSSGGDVMFHPNKEYISTKITADYPLKQNSLMKTGSVDFYLEEEDTVASFRVIEDLEWHLIVVQPKREAFQFLREMAKNYGFLMIILLFPIILVSFFITKKIIRPLKSLSLAAKKVARGDFEVRADVLSKDELGELAESFNKMTEELREAKEKMEEEKNVLEIKVDARTRELSQLNKGLEDKVKERTAEMEKKLRELEKMSKLMVGRELKMVEIKKKLRETEEELEKFRKEIGQ